MVPGARSKFGALIFEPDVFRKQMHFLEESTCDNVGAFLRLRSDSAPPASEELCPTCAPVVTPLSTATADDTNR